MSNVINPSTDCFSGDVLLSVISALRNPADIERVRMVCKTWRNQYSVQNMIGDMVHDKCLWTKLTNITQFIKDGNIHYYCINKWDLFREEHSVAQILIVQVFNLRNGIAYGSWVTPFFLNQILRKRPLVENQMKQLIWSEWSQGQVIRQNDTINRLASEGLCYQVWGNIRIERNIVISTEQLLTAIKANNIKRGRGQETNTSI